MIACDTSALSHFFRRSQSDGGKVAQAVEDLIEADSLALFGIVRQELLSGIKLTSAFVRIETATRALPLFLAEDEDHTMAAGFYNTCRSKGIQGSPVDFLICAMAVRRKFAIYTTDPDFEQYQSFIPIDLYRP